MKTVIYWLRMLPSAFLLLAALAAPTLLPALGQREPQLPAEASGTGDAAAEPAAPDPAPQDPLQARLAALGFQLPQKAFEAPNFQLEALDGSKVNLGDFRGKVVFLNFWATWCPPCREEMPSMQSLYRQLGGKDFVVLAVDLQEDNKTVDAFVREHALTFPVLLDRTGRVGQTYGARSIPTTYLIDRQGLVIARTIGGREWGSAEVIDLFQDLIGR